MSWFFGSPDVGDWVRTTKSVPVTLTDSLMGTGLPAGTRGVVLEAGGLFGTWLVVKLDGGFAGRVTVRLRASHVRVLRRRAGVDRFDRAVARRTAMRAGATLALVAPIVWFVGSYVVSTGGTDGMLPALAEGVILSFIELVQYFVTSPMQAAIYCALAWGFGRLAFGRW